jgi:hypothetical protein
MKESDLDNAIAQAEQFLILARDLKAGLRAQSKAISEAESEAIAQKLSDKDREGRVITARYYNKMDGTRLMGSVKHACVTLSFFLAKLRK